MTTATEPREDTETARVEPRRPAPGKPTLTISLPRATLLRTLGIVLALAAILAFAALYWSARTELGSRDAQAADQRHAEQVATTYAVGAASIDFQHTDAWLAKLKAGTTPALAAKFDTTAPKLEQILTSLRWTSTATPIAATVSSESGGIYQVNVFVTVKSTDAQNTDGSQSTVTYLVTVDRGNNWQITDVGGLDGALPGKWRCSNTIQGSSALIGQRRSGTGCD